MTKFVALLVEDDVLQREALADVLKDDGFEVVECSTAEAAELIVATSGTELCALITEQNLDGHMLGSDLAAYARQQCPELNIVLMSGERQLPFRRVRGFFKSHSCRGSCLRRFARESASAANNPGDLKGGPRLPQRSVDSCR
jgi:CheY-like chemotaxis protein